MFDSKSTTIRIKDVKNVDSKSVVRVIKQIPTLSTEEDFTAPHENLKAENTNICEICKSSGNFKVFHKMPLCENCIPNYKKMLEARKVARQ